jgi:hypothetical protein
MKHTFTLHEDAWLRDGPVRQVFVAAVQGVPADDTERCKILAALYDPTDDDRGESALQRFREIRTEVVRKNVSEKIGRLLNG